MIAKIQPKEKEEPKEREFLFRSHMCVKDNQLHLIIESGIQKNLISIDFINILNYK